MTEQYLFIWPHGVLHELAVIAQKPSLIKDDHILFRFWYKESQEFEVLKQNIIGVFDETNGTVEIIGRSGKYRILNEKLFKEYLKQGVIKLK